MYKINEHASTGGVRYFFCRCRHVSTLFTAAARTEDEKESSLLVSRTQEGGCLCDDGGSAFVLCGRTFLTDAVGVSCLIGRTQTDAVRTITREEGPLALYKGVVPALMLCGQGAVQFAVYEWLKARVPKENENVS